MISFCHNCSKVVIKQEIAAKTSRWQNSWEVQQKSKIFHVKLLQMVQIYAIC